MAKETYKSGAVKLMIAGFLVRIMGFANRIFMSNLIGAEGMGLFQLTSPVYTLIILTLTAGVSISVSSMTAQEKAKGNEQNALRVAKTGFAFLLVFGTFIGILLVAFSKYISINILGDERTYLSLVLLAPCIPIVAAASSIKGYFYGAMRVTPTAISQVVEQIVRIGVIFVLAVQISKQSLAYACALATISAAIGEMANLLVVSVVFFKETKKPFLKDPTISRRETAYKIAKMSFPVSVNRFLTSIMGTIEAILLPARFLAGGLNYTASIETLGRLSGMASPLIYFPTVITSSLATTLVPAIAQAISLKNHKLANTRITRCIKLSFLLGFACFAGFYTFGDYIGEFFYRGQGVGRILKDMSWLCILLYLQQTMMGILNGLGKQGYALVSTTIGYVVRISFIWFAVPVYGIAGYIWGSAMSMLVMTVIDIIFLIKNTNMFIDLREWLVKPMLPAVTLFSVGSLSLQYLSSYRNGWIVSGILSCLCAFIMIALFNINSLPINKIKKI